MEGSPYHIQVISDHKNLEYFLSSKQLNRRQARWLEFLSAFNFEIEHQPSSLNGRVDAHSRQVNLMEGRSQEQQPLLRLVALESYQLVWTDDCILKCIKVATAKDPMLQPMLAFLKKDSHQILGDMCHWL